jgi:uncharacterized protein YegL
MDMNYCDITVLLDRSGSMNGLQNDTIGGFNRFVDEQKKVAGKALLTLIQFDGEYEVNYSCLPLSEVKDLTTETYIPRGSTALLDALGKSIVAAGWRFSTLHEEYRPGKVIFLIITDGQENASLEYTGERIKSMVKEQTDTYNWQFVYIGANVDSFDESAKLGIQLSNAYNYKATGQGVAAAFAGLSMSTTNYRSFTKTSMAFTDDEKATIDSGNQ